MLLLVSNNHSGEMVERVVARSAILLFAKARTEDEKQIESKG